MKPLPLIGVNGCGHRCCWRYVDAQSPLSRPTPEMTAEWEKALNSNLAAHRPMVVPVPLAGPGPLPFRVLPALRGGEHCEAQIATGAMGPVTDALVTCGCGERFRASDASATLAMNEVRRQHHEHAGQVPERPVIAYSGDRIDEDGECQRCGAFVFTNRWEHACPVIDHAPFAGYSHSRLMLPGVDPVTPVSEQVVREHFAAAGREDSRIERHKRRAEVADSVNRCNRQLGLVTDAGRGGEAFSNLLTLRCELPPGHLNAHEALTTWV